MLVLSNDQLTLSVLNPDDQADRTRFGTRYCTGGYIFQVVDAKVGDLLSGPTFPDSFNVFDGQGIPDSFSRVPLLDPLEPSDGLVIGVGLCDLTEDTVVEPCEWDVLIGEMTLTFWTHQAAGNFALDLQRRIELHGRTVRSTTWLENRGKIGFQMSWYPHPFFPQPEGDELCRLNFPVSLPDNPGYELGPSGFITRRNWPWTTDQYLAVDHDTHSPLTVIQRHPKLGLVTGSFTYIPRFFPIWGNTRTFSWEPYFENTVAPGQELAWAMTYDF